MIVCTAIVSAAAISVAAESGRIRGDADGDGAVTVIDATVYRALAGGYHRTLQNRRVCQRQHPADAGGIRVTSDAVRLI